LAETLDRARQAVAVWPTPVVSPRAWHSATVLTDGRVLFAGGILPSGETLDTAELWDPTSGAISTPTAFMLRARAHHHASILEDGRVALSGGDKTQGKDNSDIEIFDPELNVFVPGTGVGVDSSTRLSGSIPESGSIDVPVTTAIALRFSSPIDIAALPEDSIQLRSADRVLRVDVVPVDDGRLVFVRANEALAAGQAYEVHVNGLRGTAGRPVPEAVVSFSTTTAKPSPQTPTDEEAWMPTGRDAWRTGRAASPWQSLPPLQAPPGVTAVSGQVLRLNGQPMPDVTLTIDARHTRTDRTGRFLLTDVPAGHKELIIDGRSTGTPGQVYGVFEVGIEVADRRTNVLPFTSWMPRIDTVHAVTIANPTTGETVISTPLIPSLELRIPAGSVIRDIDGKVATQVSITPIPLDRPPFPLPDGVYVPLYFTVQPGGGYVYAANAGQQVGARLHYPNYRQDPAGKRFDFWHYDPEGRGWYVYGQGGVTPDRKQIVPDPGVAIYEFTGAMVAPPSFAPAAGPVPCNSCRAGDPVDLGTGLFVMKQTDLALPGLLPLGVTRTYRTQDSRSRAFGIGATLSYDMFLVGNTNPYTYVELILPDGGRVHYDRTSPGTGFSSAIYEHVGTPGTFYKSIVRFKSGGPTGVLWELVLRNGTYLTFPEGDFATVPQQAALIDIRDRFGNSITLVRDGTGNLTRVSSTDGTHAIDFTYDTSNRITQARDNSGRYVGYEYNTTGTLKKVTDANGGTTEYTYDAGLRLKTIKDPRGIVYLTNDYDGGGRVSKQTMADGSTVGFAYTVDGSGRITQTDVTDPRGVVRRVEFNPAGFWRTDTRAVGRPEQQATILLRETTSNAVTRVTDPLNRQTAYGYDATGNVTSVTELDGTPDAIPTTVTYVSDGWTSDLGSVTNALQKTTTFTYDERGRFTGFTDPLGHRVQATSNTFGQTVALDDGAGLTSLTYSDATISTLTNPLGQTSTYTYDGLGRVRVSTSPIGTSRAFTYSPFNQVLSVYDGLGETTFGHDANGNLLSVKDANHNETGYTYDSMNRVASRTDALLRSETYSYDASGNLLQSIDRKGQPTTYAYDGLNRLTSASYADGSFTSYTYDAGDRLRQVADSNSGTVVLDYDLLDRLITETTSRGTITNEYDDLGRRTRMTVSGRTPVDYGYDDANRMTSITQGSKEVTFEYDAADRRTAMGLPNGVRLEYAYDLASRLTGLTYKLGAATLGTLTYAYDANGRRTEMGGTWARTLLPNPVTSATYDATNRLTSLNGALLTYDFNGNLVTESSRTYSWDARNRLSAIGGSVSASFVYDGFGRRTSLTTAAGTVDVLHDGDEIVAELMGGTVTADVLRGPRIDEALSRSDAAGSLTIVADGLGSAVALIDASGVVRTQYTYESFGSSSATGMASANPTQFTGREDDGTGLYYYRARYYSPSLQRFISEDPTDFGGGDANLYAYVFNSPTNGTDPTGQAVPILAAAAGACAGGAAFDVGWDLVFSGPKADPWSAAKRGCLSGLIGFGVGKALGALVGRLASTTADTVAEGSRLSIYRLTQPGETFIRYESGHPGYTRIWPGGAVKPDTFAAPASDGIVPFCDVNDVYQLKDPQIPRTVMHILKPPAGTTVVGPGPVPGGSGNQVLFPFGWWR
jgi:RHS repeat-associated protein